MRDMEIHYIHQKGDTAATNQRESNDSTTSGAYMSFDDIEYSSLEIKVC